jgi:hypothetical protein
MVSVVIVNWNSGPLLAQCLRSLAAHGGDCEVIVVDNASRDTSLEFAPPPRLRLEIVRNGRNLGCAAGNNLGWRRSAGESVLFLNPDTECLPGALASLAERLGASPEHWAAAGQLVDPAGRLQAGFNVRAFPTVASVTAQMLLLEALWPGNPWSRRYRMSDWDHRTFRYVEQPAGACLMVRRRALEALEGFDESFHPAWFEDVDLCRRIYNSGGLIAYEPAARFVHHGGTSLRSLSRGEFLEYFHTNQCRYFAKHHGRRAARAVRRRIVAGLLVRALAALIRRPQASTHIEEARACWSAARRLRRPEAP